MGSDVSTSQRNEREIPLEQDEHFILNNLCDLKSHLHGNKQGSSVLISFIDSMTVGNIQPFDGLFSVPPSIDLITALR